MSEPYLSPLFTSLLKHQDPVTAKWMDSGNMWLQRSALLFQLRYKQQTDEKLLFRYITELTASKEFFIRKAIGWTLREYSKTKPDQVQQFVAKTPMAPLSKKEALRIILLLHYHH
jgi:3-methyladenine DNA glycosylase AlkD